jgi:hypothetical protein
MYEHLVEAIQDESRRLASAQRNAVKAVQVLLDEKDNTISFSDPISDGDRSISDLDTLTSSLVKFADGFREDKNWSFVPRIWITEFRDALKNTANSFENLANNLATIDTQHGGLASIDATTLGLTTKSGTVIDLRKLLSNISINIDNGYAAYFRMRPAISAPRLTEFGDLFGFFAMRRAELDGLSQELSRLSAQSREAAALATKAAEKASAEEASISKLREEAIKKASEIQSASTNSAASVKSINEIKDSAEELSEVVVSYQTTFDKFQTDLEVRNNDYSKKKKAYEDLKALLDSEQQRIETISLQADDMLKGATNAGLAGSYSKKQIAIEKEITKARLAYYVSIGLLVFLTLPIFIYSFPREYVAEIFKYLFGVEAPLILTRDVSQPEIQQILNFLARAVLLIPGLMFVRFASMRHEILFRLREDYAYKYSIASSVDGFMKQAKAYADDIAAACYYELTYNPAERMDGKAEDARMMNPLFERMLARLENRLVKSKKPVAAE